MRASLSVTALALALVFVSAPSAAAQAGDSTTAIAYGQPTCSGTICLRSITAFDVRSGPSGENVSGWVELFQESFAAGQSAVTSLGRGPALCLRVVGNRASVAFHLTEVSPIFPPSLSRYGTIVAEDGSTDRIMRTFSATAPAACLDPAAAALEPIAGGNVNVHDALTRAEARASCQAEREILGRRAFRDRYGDQPGRTHAMRNCIAQKMV